MRQRPGIAPTDALLATTTLSFDIAALELFLPLLVGARVILAKREALSDPQRIKRALAGNRVTMMQATPATWSLLAAQDERSLREQRIKALCGGEQLPAQLARRLVENVSSTLWNMYGPTETTVWSSTTQVVGDVHLGRPIANTQIYVLDEHLRPAPVGVAGEIHIAGAGVARGYWGRAGLTAERFIADPFAEEAGARMYKTGDMGRHRADGSLEYLGRNDSQVKIRGYRVELGEIEAKLSQHPGVREAVVIARDEGEKRLIAYYLRLGLEAPSAESLRSHLRSQLPDYMVPSAYVNVEQWPLTPNGKLDLKSLPAPGGEAYVVHTYEPPEGETEEILSRIWSELLGVDRVGRHDNFFELGGHSLIATRLIARVGEGMQAGVSLGTLLGNPTLASFAEALLEAQLASFPTEDLEKLAAKL
jgi:acyl-coenzyme A synthetase/AMP-(fatty) acid ligase